MNQRIAQIILTEVNHPLGMSRAENLRAAAWYVKEEFPAATSSDFGDAAVVCGLHRQAAMNRWNEAMANLEMANGAVAV